MADGSLNPAEAADLVRQLNEQRGGGRRGGVREPMPPPPPGPATEEPPLPQEILDEMNAVRRSMGLVVDGDAKQFQPEGDSQGARDPVLRVGTLASPSGLESPAVLAIRVTQPPSLITSAGDVPLTVAEEKALNQICGRILRRHVKGILTQVTKTYGG